MAMIQAQIVGEQILLPKAEWERLLEMARCCEPVEVQFSEVPRTFGLGGAFDFWLDEGEDVYTLEDGEPIERPPQTVA